MIAKSNYRQYGRRVSTEFMHVEVQVSGSADLSALGAAFGEGIYVVLPDAHLLWFALQGQTTDPDLEAQTLCTAIDVRDNHARDVGPSDGDELYGSDQGFLSC
jgi:hypothetical protein